MGRLVLLLLSVVVLGMVGFVCFAITLRRMIRARGWRRGLVGLFFPPALLAWGLSEEARRHGRGTVALGAAATVAALVVSIALDLSMG